MFRTSAKKNPHGAIYTQNNRLERAFKFIPIQPHHFRDEEKKNTSGTVTCFLKKKKFTGRGKKQGIAIDFRVCRQFSSILRRNNYAWDLFSFSGF